MLLRVGDVHVLDPITLGLIDHESKPIPPLQLVVTKITGNTITVDLVK